MTTIKHIVRRGSHGLLATSLLFCAGFAQAAAPEFKGKIGKTYAESEQWWPEKKAANPGAPNVVWFLIDDAGWGAASAFGGLAETPTLDALANNGLRYTNFHTNAICSPTRAALQTGRNPHSVHMGLFPVTATGFPGYDGRIPASAGTIAEILRENDYNTYAVGKWHLTPINEITSIGPYDRWPLGKGYDHFYGFHLGHTDQYRPNLYEDNKVIDVGAGKHVSTLLADKAIEYIANQKSLAPEKPFFLYFATGATHSPHQVDAKWSDLYKGKFDQGWDWYREEALARQKKLGIVPADATLPARHPNVPAWDSLSPEARQVYARYMEIYAGFMTHADYEFGRVVDYLKQIGQFDNTVIFAVIGDNGASPSSLHGSLNPATSALPKDQQVAAALKQIDKLGTGAAFQDAPFGWTQAANTPFRLWKVDANAEGGTRNPLIVHYPKVIKEKGGVRNQYGHVIDLLPTTVELVGGKLPAVIKGAQQEPIQGKSLLYSFNDAKAPSQRTLQYYEIRGKRAIYKDGWKASVDHQPGTDFAQDVWELYNLNEDFNERNNLAAKHPAKLKELQAVFDAEAKKHNVYPLDDRSKSGGRARSAFGKKDRIVLYPGVDQLLNFAGPQFEATSFSITAEVDIKSSVDEGVLFSTGGAFDGLSLFIQGGKFVVAHNTGSVVRHLESNLDVVPGKHRLKFELNHAAGDATKAGSEAIYIDAQKVGERGIDKAESRYIAVYKDGVDVGRDLNSPVSDRYKVPFEFTGKLEKVEIEYK